MAVRREREREGKEKTETENGATLERKGECVLREDRVEVWRAGGPRGVRLFM